MQCPSCESNHKIREGMVCSCGYHFALNPKEKPYISDMVVKRADDLISDGGETYYTWHQFYARLHHIFQDKASLKPIGPGLVIVIIAIMIIFVFDGGLTSLLIYAGVVAFLLLIKRIFRPAVPVTQKEISDVIDQYTARHPLENMVDGRYFQEEPGHELNREILKYAPEKILIVERDEVVDMLLRNHFHAEQKTLVVSSKKYPGFAFRAFQHIIDKHADIPVYIMHDASQSGQDLMNRLRENPSWKLKDRNVQDLGLHLEDVDQLKDNIWIHSGGVAGKSGADVLPGKSAAANIEKGFYAPVDVAGPKAISGTMSLAMTTGMALLSGGLLVEQYRLDRAAGSSSGGGGFG